MIPKILTDSNLTFRKIYAGTVFSLTLLAVIIFFGYQGIQETRKSSEWVSHTLQVIADLQETKAVVNELGTTQRGYIITGQKPYADSFQTNLHKLEKLIDKLQSETRDNSIQQNNLIELRRPLRMLTEIYSENMRRVEAGRAKEAILIIKAGTAQNYFLQTTSILEHLLAEEEGLLKKRFQAEKKASDFANTFIITGSLGAFLLLLAAAIIIIFEFRRRIVAQDVLHQTSLIQKTILDSAAFAIIATDESGKITLFNPAAQKLLGYTTSEVMGKSPVIFHLAEEIALLTDHINQDLEEEKIPVGAESLFYRAQHGIVEAEQWHYSKKDGQRIPVSLTISPQLDSDEKISGYVLIAHDISRQLEFETNIIRAKEDALAGTQAKTEFLSNMSHEIRTPMNAILGMAELLSETALSDEQRKYVDVFQRAGQGLLQIINDILDLSKIEAGHFELDRTPFNIENVIEETTDIMALRAHQKHLELAVDVEQTLPLHFLGDPNRLRQILLNLLGNAVKFTRRGEVLLKVFSGALEGNQQEIVLEIQDTGIGMNENQVQGLFRRFSQADSSITKEFGGTGLGLSITKSLVKMMDGTIEVSSTLGIGTRFTVRIFLELNPDVQEIHSSFVDLTGKKILIVDDTRTNRLILKKILEHQKAIVREAENGEAALMLINEAHATPYDLILLDCRMPGADGFEVAQKVKEKSTTFGPLLMMLTSDDRPGDLTRSRLLGLNSYLVKPVMKNELLKEISKAFNSADLTPTRKDKELSGTQSGKPLNILLVDDNEENRLVIKAFLKNFPWKIEEAKNGQESLVLFQHKTFDLVLMDMQMPVMDGYTATREIRKVEHNKKLSPVPIIALTAYAMKEEIDKSLLAGCNSHIVKPVSKYNLIDYIKEVTEEIYVTIDEDLKDLIPDYLEKRKAELTSLTAALNTQDYNLIQATGHKLRGSAGSYGLPGLSNVGKDLEEKASVQDRAAIRHALTQYQFYLSKVKIS